MSIIIHSNTNLESIIAEAKKLNDLEQKELLAYIRVLIRQKEKQKPIVTLAKGQKLMSMEEIDQIKHDSRHYYAK